QFPVALESRGAGSRRNQRPFSVPMVLQGKTNKVEIELPRLKQEASSRREFSLACKGPTSEQRPHGLIGGGNGKDGEALRKNVLSAWCEDLPRGFEGDFKSKAFSRARLAGVLFGNVQKEAVVGQLGEIEKQIAVMKEQSGGLTNDVVFLYYQGG